MSRCDYDALFYRVFCVTLLAVAFTFTIILTNVFVDIDGLLSKKQAKHKNQNNENGVSLQEFTAAPIVIDDSYGDNDDSYRTKRAIESQNILFHIKNPKLQSFLTNRLMNLLEQLDAKKFEQDAAEKNIPKDINIEDRFNSTPQPKLEIKDISKEIVVENDTEEKIKKKDDETLRLTMHNILLLGVIRHMDMKEVFKRVNALLLDFENDEERKVQMNQPKPQQEKAKTSFKLNDLIKDKIIAHMMKCKQNRIINEPNKLGQIDDTIKQAKQEKQGIVKNMSLKMKTEDLEAAAVLHENGGTDIMIKTIVDVKPIGKGGNYINYKENVHRIVELVCNGKSMKFSQPDTKNTFNIQPRHRFANVKSSIATNKDKSKNISTENLNRFFAEYFKILPTYEEHEITEEINENIQTKRLKRHVKVKFDKEDNLSQVNEGEHLKPKIKNEEDDELFVEIETHFDSKGLKGEKKKKLVRSLIDKIEKAIHPDETKKQVDKNKNKIHKHLHVRKRLQNPLKHMNRILSGKQLPAAAVGQIEHRQLNPIAIPKILPIQGPSPLNMRDKLGSSWRKGYIGPAFLTGTKSINSAEMSELDVDYNKVLDVNGIPQRLQKPLNTDMSADDAAETNSLYDLGKMKFFIKDVDGSGFAIGFNQYVDDAPDPEAMKLFTGIEDVIKTYHQTYDTPDEPSETGTEGHQTSNNNQHVLVKRSIDKSHDYHSNEYKVIYKGNFLPFHDSKDIFEKPRSERKSSEVYTATGRRLARPVVVNENIINKKLKPAEIFGLANLLRKKRSMTIKKISNLKSKMKINRYLNTKSLSSKRLYLNSKRTKRQVNKIRIVASDPANHYGDENVFVVSAENMFADRAIVKEPHFSTVASERSEDQDNVSQNSQNDPSYRLFEDISRHNSLMSKYPHVFLEEISKRDDDGDINPNSVVLLDDLPAFSKLKRSKNRENIEDKEIKSSLLDQHKNVQNENYDDTTETVEGVKDIVEALHMPKSNYKVTVKITPKNTSTGLNSKVKKVFTSINKSFNKNGLVYSSLVDVSEITKISKINKSHELDSFNRQPFIRNLDETIKDQQSKMQYLLRQHQKHIDETLEKLHSERSDIDSILVDQSNNTHTHFDNVGSPSNDAKKLSINENSQSTTETVPKTEIVVTTTQKTIHKTVASAPRSLPRNDIIKNNILHTMQRNENLTGAILKKIDQNTEILKIFLKKLTDNIGKDAAENKLKARNEDSEQALPNFEKNHFAIDWKNPFNMNNMRIEKNDSYISIPFIYAYQHPILSHHKELIDIPPIARVVYHGHIHANTIHPTISEAKAAGRNINVNIPDFPVEKVKIHAEIPVENIKLHTMADLADTKNQSRFFLDEPDSDYKVIPIPMEVAKVQRNVTGV